MNRKQAIKTRTVPFVFSDETRDAYGTVLPVEGWDLAQFNRMGPALYNHSSYGNDPDNVIGTARAWVEGKKLLGEITFETADINPKAEKVFQKVLAGTLKGCSVGFRSVEPGKWGEGEEGYSGSRPTYYYGRRSLVEISITPMPANPNARVRSAMPPEEEPRLSGETEYLTGTVRAFDPEEEIEVTATDPTPAADNEQRQATDAAEAGALEAEAKAMILIFNSLKNEPL